MRRAVAAAAAWWVASATACGGHQSQYVRAQPAPGELVWAFHDGFQVTQDGKLIAEQSSWDALPAAVACVPRARAWADEAVARDRTGRTLVWIGAGALLTGVIAGTALIVSDPHSNPRVFAGLGLAFGGLFGGEGVWVGGSLKRGRADAGAIDAVNLYNDERASCAPHPEAPAAGDASRASSAEPVAAPR